MNKLLLEAVAGFITLIIIVVLWGCNICGCGVSGSGSFGINSKPNGSSGISGSSKSISGSFSSS